MERKDKISIFYQKEDKRIFWTKTQSTSEYWDEIWNIKDDIRSKIFNNKKDLFSEITKEFLKPNSVILEGGCGNGNHVATLIKNGFKAIGIDYAKRTVEGLNKYVPELDIRIGDIRNLPIEDRSIDGYWSIGVIEHFPNGYDAILSEMKRVLKPGGIIFLVFPHMSPIRKLMARLGIYKTHTGDLPKNFFQFALNPKSVLKNFEKNNFKLVKYLQFEPIHILKEIPIINKFYIKFIEKVKNQDKKEINQKYQEYVTFAHKENPGIIDKVRNFILFNLSHIVSYSLLLVLQKSNE